ncbi:MBL fold metallo-hydrolase [Paenibacillus ginsengarvi]|uniref:Ribonuclease Z n=1 Tax=Paenibacillus ginsengarvi TaxID=400777 RepID=A0A3B0BCF6_9BACL|nr:ribonuclease Z [Paenibacillus ginsengarvi]RKN70048.1 ribonuclease Z [Paenibacillus ginsengarvi]
MDIVFLGTASAAGSFRRDNTYLLLRHGEDGWLIDVGGNPLGKLKQLSMLPAQIRGVILTHFHTDHIYGLPSLLWGMWIAGRTEPLTIYCSETGVAQLRTLLDGYEVKKWPIRFELDIRPFDWMTPSALFESDGLILSVFPALHAGPTVGVTAQIGGKTLVYSADTKPNSWIRDLPRIDLLVHEATAARGSRNNHTTLEEIVHYYDPQKIKRIIAVHLTDCEPYEDVLAEAGGAAITLAEDMQVTEL